MMGGMDGGRRLFEREVLKPKNLGATLGRFGQYFRHYWLGLTPVIALIIVSTWTQVTSPDIIGQAFDCYLPAETFGGAAADNCWYTEDDAAAITIAFPQMIRSLMTRRPPLRLTLSSQVWVKWYWCC
ncbi:MAG: hypothetical protein U0694_10110 [Anaerolineae bacterium]